jgi:hypothetical protein
MEQIRPLMQPFGVRFSLDREELLGAPGSVERLPPELTGRSGLPRAALPE